MIAAATGSIRLPAWPSNALFHDGRRRPRPAYPGVCLDGRSRSQAAAGTAASNSAFQAASSPRLSWSQGWKPGRYQAK